MLLPYYAIGSEADKIEKGLTAEFMQHFDPVFVSKTGMSLPIILPDETARLVFAIWGIPGKKTFRIPWISSAGIVKNRNTRFMIRKQRCLVPANGIYVKTPDAYYFIYIPKIPVFTLGGIFTIRQQHETGHQVIEFSIVTHPVSTGLGKLAPDMPLIISGSSRRKYLNRERPLMDITQMMNRETKLKFNGLKVSPEIFSKKNPGKSDFNKNGQKFVNRQKFPEKEILGSYYFY